MKLSHVLFITALAMGLSGCVTRVTNYTAPVASSVSGTWALAGVHVIVPDTLTTSEENTYAPEFDIIWHGDFLDPLGQDTRQMQVAEILKDGITDAGIRLSGERLVTIHVTLLQFHALTPKAYATVGGIHNVDFLLRVVDAITGEPLSEQVFVQADEFAYSGAMAMQAMMNGQTQKVRIRNRIRMVVANWLGVAIPGEEITLGRIRVVGR